MLMAGGVTVRVADEPLPAVRHLRARHGSPVVGAGGAPSQAAPALPWWGGQDLRPDQVVATSARTFLVAMSFAALVRFMPYLGNISLRDDVVERDNPAAAIAITGAVLGVVAASLCILRHAQHHED